MKKNFVFIGICIFFTAANVFGAGYTKSVSIARVAHVCYGATDDCVVSINTSDDTGCTVNATGTISNQDARFTNAKAAGVLSLVLAAYLSGKKVTGYDYVSSGTTVDCRKITILRID